MRSTTVKNMPKITGKLFQFPEDKEAGIYYLLPSSARTWGPFFLPQLDGPEVEALLKDSGE